METLKNIRFDLNRILLQLFIPGIFSALPYFLLFINSNTIYADYFKEYEGMCTSLLIIISLTIGMILEDIGSLIEYEYDKSNKKKYLEKEQRDTDNEWKSYLQLNLSEDQDIVAQRYLRTILIRMKFELSFCVSLVIMIIGLLLLNITVSFVDNWLRFILVCFLLPMALSLYLLWEAKNSSELLIKVRKWILERHENQE